jgi:hypothetical protein
MADSIFCDNHKECCGCDDDNVDEAMRVDAGPNMKRNGDNITPISVARIATSTMSRTVCINFVTCLGIDKSADCNAFVT